MKGGRNSAITISPIGSVLRCPAVCVLKTKNWTFITYDPRETDSHAKLRKTKKEKKLPAGKIVVCLLTFVVRDLCLVPSQAKSDTLALSRFSTLNHLFSLFFSDSGSTVHQNSSEKKKFWNKKWDDMRKKEKRAKNTLQYMCSGDGDIDKT